jgi:hypothetical protein
VQRSSQHLIDRLLPERIAPRLDQTALCVNDFPLFHKPTVRGIVGRHQIKLFVMGTLSKQYIAHIIGKRIIKIEILHPGGFDLTKRTAEIAGLRSDIQGLDVSSGRGTQAIFYAKNYGVQVTGIDIS